MRATNFGDVFSLKVLLGLIIVLTQVLFLEYFAASGLEVFLSSTLVTLTLLLQLKFAVQNQAATPADIVVFIFNWLFLDLAPKVQLLSTPQQLVNTSRVAPDILAMANVSCALFILMFTAVYRYMTRQAPAFPAVSAAASRTSAPPNFTGAAIGVAILLCTACVALGAPAAYKTGDEIVISPASLIVARVFLFVPSATFLILLYETVRSGRKISFTRFCALSILFAYVLVTENPYTEKRNALGPVYIGILLVLFPNWFARGLRRLWLLVLGMVIAFPVSSVFTTHDRGESFGNITMEQVWETLQAHYFSINYDSWANVYSSVEFVRVHSLQWGHQLLGALLFFVPSSVWTAKPMATGIFLAKYLMTNYSMWFTNLSAPLVAEGYLDFGYVGVVGYAAALAGFVTLLNRLAVRRERWVWYPACAYTSVFLMIILRGSLMIAIAYAIAAFLAFAIASAMLSMELGVSRRPIVLPAKSHQPNLAS